MYNLIKEEKFKFLHMITQMVNNIKDSGEDIQQVKKSLVESYDKDFLNKAKSIAIVYSTLIDKDTTVSATLYSWIISTTVTLGEILKTKNKDTEEFIDELFRNSLNKINDVNDVLTDYIPKSIDDTIKILRSDPLGILQEDIENRLKENLSIAFKMHILKAFPARDMIDDIAIAI